MSQISPIILQAQISPPAGGGSFGLADSTRLENPFQTPMWLDEIRFRMPIPEGGSRGQAWSSLSIELRLGNTPITRSFVPISLFGKVLNDSRDFGESGVNGGTTPYSPDVFTWKLPKPLFIPAREFLRPTLYFTPYSGAPATTVTIMYCCRPLPAGTPAPQVMQIPWVSYFKPPNLTTPAAVDSSDQSTPSDLYNPWDEELHVQRFVGRLMGQNLGEDQQHMSLASANINLNTGALVTGTLVSAQDSFNNILIRDRTPFAHVFDFIDRAWTVNCILPPKGFYLFTVDRLWSAYNPSPAFTATVGISMVGWREVQVRRDPRDAIVGPPVSQARPARTFR